MKLSELTFVHRFTSIATLSLITSTYLEEKSRILGGLISLPLCWVLDCGSVVVLLVQAVR